jgi:hypothetical protein
MFVQKWSSVIDEDNQSSRRKLCLSATLSTKGPGIEPGQTWLEIDDYPLLPWLGKLAIIYTCM